MKFYNNVDFNKNQIINVRLHNSASHPTAPVDGQIYYNTTDNLVYYYNADIPDWVSVGSGTVTDVLDGDGLSRTVAAGVITLNVNVDNATLEIDSDIVRIKDLGVTTAKIANNAVTTTKIGDNQVTTVKIANSAITFAKIQNVPTMTVIGRTAVGTGVTSDIAILDEDDMVSNSATSLATQQSIKAYVDSKVAAIGTLVGGFNASTATDFPGGAGVNKGDYRYVTNAGTVHGIDFNVGDVLVAAVANPSVSNPADWIFLETNRDQATTTVLGLVMLATAAEVNTGTDAVKVVTPATLNQRTATETRTGLIEIATQAEVNVGTDDARAITPLKLKTWWDSVSGGYASNVGDGINSSFTLTHSLNSKDLIASLQEVATGDIVYTNTKFPSVNTVTLDFGMIPTSAQFRLVLYKVTT